MEITLYYTPQTRAVRPRWMLEELGVDYKLHNIDLFSGEGESPEYKKINPLGAVPAMKIDDLVMLESGAMCSWLANFYADKNLAPDAQSPDRPKYEQWMMYSQATLEMQPWLVLLHTKILPESDRIEEIVPWAEKRQKKILSVLNDDLGDNNYLLGKDFSAADIMVGSTLMFAAEALEPFPTLQAYVKRLQERPAFKRAVTDN